MEKGFTLIELLAVIVILGIISTITGLAIGGIINNSEKNLSKVQKENIEKAAEEFFIKEGLNDFDYEKESFKVCVDLNYLVSNGYFDAKEVKNPDGSETMDGSVVISYEANQYNYKYIETNCSAENYDYIWNLEQIQETE